MADQDSKASGPLELHAGMHPPRVGFWLAPAIMGCLVPGPREVPPSRRFRARPRIWLELANRSDHAVWVVLRLTAPFPDRTCEHRFMLPRKGRGRTLCTQDSVVAGENYAAAVSVFADSASTHGLESSSWNVQLERSAVADWEEKRQLGAQPPVVTVESTRPALQQRARFATTRCTLRFETSASASATRHAFMACPSTGGITRFGRLMG